MTKGDWKRCICDVRVMEQKVGWIEVGVVRRENVARIDA